jgi:hypothetical protein
VIGSGCLPGEDYLVTGKAITNHSASKHMADVNYSVMGNKTKDHPARVVSESHGEYWKWHTCLRHIGKERMKALMEQGLINTVPITTESCPKCTKAILRRQSHPPFADESTQKGTVLQTYGDQCNCLLEWTDTSW